MPYSPRRWNDKPKPAPKPRRKYTPPFEPIPCELVFIDGNRIMYPSRKQALKALGKYVRNLPPDPNGGQKAWIENL